ncbi:hypothetical protein NQ315_006052 [Exocentrus adspersus]|uniref:Uncharacterized protein n=1 Tax=Exocentrus adspersus TaxID=1586481 RepID=A0AAV8VG20_9CUCU|nr:hypothetical protein NQ315_006052 [Exocentrus adspersus]
MACDISNYSYSSEDCVARSRAISEYFSLLLSRANSKEGRYSESMKIEQLKTPLIYQKHLMNHWKWWWKHSQIYRKYEVKYHQIRKCPLRTMNSLSINDHVVI